MNRFLSLDSLRAAHSTLMQVHREQSQQNQPISNSLLNQIETFIEQGQATGAVLDVEAERLTAQGLLDYWSTILDRAGQDAPDASLAEFDASLAPDLPDALCPYVGLDAFHESDQGLFFGRRRLVHLLVERMAHERMLVVVGPSGSGKSSVVLAGLIPVLKNGAISGNEAGDAQAHADLKGGDGGGTDAPGGSAPMPAAPSMEHPPLIPSPSSSQWRYAPHMVPGSDPLANLARVLRSAGAEGHRPNVDFDMGLDTEIDPTYDLNQGLSRDMDPENFTAGDLIAGDLIAGDLFEDPWEWEMEQVIGMIENPNHLTELVDLTGDAPVLLVVDQFEEIFTLCHDEIIRQAFIDNLINLIHSPGHRHSVVLTMRTDFENQVARLGHFQTHFERALVRVIPLTASELREVIEKPAQQVGLKFEEGVIDSLLQDILGEPAALPLLQFTLLKLWEKREHNLITWEAYKQLGGGRLALSNSADEFYTSLIPEDQITARRILLRLVRPTEGLEVTSNRVRRETLYQIGEARDRMDRVLDGLIGARLLRTSEGDVSEDVQVEVAHEALIRNWPRLVNWLEDERESIRQRLRLTQAAERWRSMGRIDDALLRGTLLEEALRYPDLNLLEAEFIQVSQSFLDRRRRQEFDQQLALAEAKFIAKAERLRATEHAEYAETLRRRAWYLSLALIVAVIAAMIAGYLYNEALSAKEAEAKARQRAERQERRAAAGELAAFTLFEIDQREDPSGSRVLLLAREAVLTTYRQEQTVEPVALAALNKAIISAPPWRMTLPKNESIVSVRSARFSPDGTMLLTASPDSVARLWDVQSRMELRQLVGHKDSVRKAIFSPDGKRIATASDDGTARIWETESGLLQQELIGHTDIVYDLSFSPDGSRLATSSADSTVRLWDTATGNELFQYNDYPESVDRIYAIAISPDGNRLAAASDDQMIRIWQAGSEATATLLTGHTDAIRSLSFSPNNRHLVSASSDRTARVWDVESGIEINLLNGHTGSVYTAHFSDDGLYLVTASADQTARLWDAGSGREIRQFLGHDGDVWSASFSPDDQAIVTSSGDRTVRIWETETGQERSQIANHPPLIWDIGFSPDGSQVATAGQDDMARVFDIPSGEERYRLQGHTDNVRSVAFRSDGRQLVTASFDQTVRIWDMETGQEVRRLLGHVGQVYSAFFHPNGRSILTASADKTARLWDATNGQEMAQFVHQEAVRKAVFSPDGGQIATASEGKEVQIWDVETGQVVQTFIGHSASVWSVAFNPEGTRIITTSADRTTRIWDVASGVELFQLKGHSDNVLSALYSPDGQRILTGSIDETARLWGAENGKELERLTGHTNLVNAAIFSPDGRQVATASFDRTARIWDVAGNKPLLEIQGHIDSVLSASYSPNGARIVTASDDGTARVWSAQNGAERLRLVGHEASVLFATFSHGGGQIATASLDGTVRLWDAENSKAIQSFGNLGDEQSFYSVDFHPDDTHLVAASKESTAYIWEIKSGLQQMLVGHTGQVWSAAFDPSGDRVVTASWDKTARIWDAASGEELRPLQGHTDWVNSAAFSPDGIYVVTASKDKTARVWHAESGFERLQLTGHADNVSSAVFNADGTQIVTTSDDQTVRLWDAETGQELLQITGHTGQVRSAVFSPDGRMIVTASTDQTARTWFANVEGLLGAAKGLVQRHPVTFSEEEQRRFLR